MKHNLANKPKLYKIPSNLSEHLKFETEIIEWFEAFEKELREKAFCSLINFKPPVKIANTQDLDIVLKDTRKNEPYEVFEFDPCRNRKCATCTIRTQYLIVKLSEILGESHE